jgi:hypothetical protein
MEEELINSRIRQMIEEYSQLVQSEFCEPPLFEVLNEGGDIRMTIWRFSDNGDKVSAEKTFAFTDDLSVISDIFQYPDYIGRQSKDIDFKGVKEAYLDEFGDLIIYRNDYNFGSTEKFKIKEKHREEIINNLKNLLKDKLKDKSKSKLKYKL